MESCHSIGKRQWPASPAWSTADTLEEVPSISSLVDAKKEELAKRLFYSVNKQGLRSMLASSFMNPSLSTASSRFFMQEPTSGQKVAQEDNKLRSFRAKENRLESLLAKIRLLLGKVEFANFHLASSTAEQELFREANVSLMHLLTKACKEDKLAAKFLENNPSEDLALALLTISSKKAKITKSKFVELAGAISTKEREELLRKGRCYYFFVWLLEGRRTTLHL